MSAPQFATGHSASEPYVIQFTVGTVTESEGGEA